jgi:hypothetical protein
MSSAQQFITTLVYQYKRYAPWMLVGYCLMILGFFILSALLPTTAVIIYCAVLFALPVYAAIYPKSVFSVRSWDDRKLCIGAENISWEGRDMPVGELENLEIYIFAFDDFKHREDGFNGRQHEAIEPGDENKLDFDFQGKSFDFTFFLSDYAQYTDLLQIIENWEHAGYAYHARAAFEPEYIAREMRFFGFLT